MKALVVAVVAVGCGGSTSDPSSQRDAGTQAASDGALASDGSTSADAPTSMTCERAAAMGDVAITEVMFQAPYYARWIELTNVSDCRVDIDDISIRSRRPIPAGYDEDEMTVAATTWLEPGARAVFSTHDQFPVTTTLVHEQTDIYSWLFTPDLVYVHRNLAVYQQLIMPENFAITVGYAFARPEGVCASADPNNARTWRLSQTAVTPNPTDFAHTGTPGAPNDPPCP
jgi:hypothetical protein